MGWRSFTSKEPTAGPWGQRIRESATNGRLALHEELELFLRDRDEHLQEVLLPALDAGKVVIVDRFLYSTIAYQGARGGDFRVLDEQVRARAQLLPDVVVVLDLDPEYALFRIARRDGKPNAFERLDNLIAVRKVFRSLCELERERLWELDGNGSREVIHRAILDIVIEHGLKRNLCTKAYGCDDPVYCGFRMQGTCEWVNIRRQLLANAPSTSPIRRALVAG